MNMMESKENEMQNVEGSENVENLTNGLSSGDGEEVKEQSSKKPDIWQKISDAIPERHAKKVVYFFVAIILLGLGFNIYSTFWGNPQMRAKLKKQTAETELLQKELDSRNAIESSSAFSREGSAVSEEVLENFNDSTPSEVIFDAYGNSIDVTENELN